MVGGDNLIGWTLRPYVEILSSKPPDWLTYTRIYIAPLGLIYIAITFCKKKTFINFLGSCSVSRHLSNLDPGYAILFPPDQDLKIDELATRIQRYLSAPPTAPVAQLALAEAMLNCQDDSSQQFIPFVNVRIIRSAKLHRNSLFFNYYLGSESWAGRNIFLCVR